MAAQIMALQCEAAEGSAPWHCCGDQLLQGLQFIRANGQLLNRPTTVLHHWGDC